MLHEPTRQKLQELRLAMMASAWEMQDKDPAIAALSFDERFSLLVDAEYQARDNRRPTRLLKDAQLRIPNACVEDVSTSATRGIEKATLRQYSSCGWISEHHNILVCGGTGVGKSYLACALGQCACRKGFKVTYRRVPRLLDELALARADGTHAKVLAKLAKFDVLVLDDWDSARYEILNATICSRCSKTDTAALRRSSPASFPSTSGTSGSETQQSPTLFGIGLSTTPTRSD